MSDRPQETGAAPSPVKHTPKTAKLLTRIYVERRLYYQMGYYQSKMVQFENNLDNAFRFNAIVMTLNSLLAAFGTVSSSSVVHLITAILPALAALISAFRQLYQWDRQSQLYKDTVLGLQRARLILPDIDDPNEIRPEEATIIFPKLVATTEDVFKEEVSQWGQIAAGDKSSEEESDEAVAEFAERYGLVDENGEIDPSKLAVIQGILQRSRSAPSKIQVTAVDPHGLKGGLEPEQLAAQTIQSTLLDVNQLDEIVIDEVVEAMDNQTDEATLP